MRGSILRLSWAVAGALLLASVATGLIASDAPLPSPSPGATDEGDDGHEHAHQHAGESQPTTSQASDEEGLASHQPRHDHALSDRPGEVPSRADASELEDHFEEFIVRGDEGLEEMVDRGYVTGEGTLEDPYVIHGFRVDQDLTIEDTSKPLVVENSFIEGQLTLNFAGEHVYVHHNYIEDLRVNENVEREGPTTAGLFADNEIAFIGQLRHFGGTFQDNEVGPRPQSVVETYLSDTGPAQVTDDLVWNFDGYHGAHVHNNTVEGLVDVKLHGHFHGSCLACPSHDHANPDAFPEEETDELAPRSQHSYRYHVLDFENNTIRAPDSDRALRFYDEAHAGDDRTANSEPNPYLEDRHEHHAYLRVHGNTLEGGSLAFDIVNAEDERHAGLVQETAIDLTENELQRDVPREHPGLVPAYELHTADNARLQAEANTYAFHKESSIAPEGYGWLVDGELAEATGFLLDGVNASHVQVMGTEGQDATYGVTLDGVRDNTDVALEDNRFDAGEADRSER